MSGYISYTSFDYVSCRKVSVIASFDSDGHIRPLYVRIGESTCKVLSSISKNEFRFGMEYNCTIADGAMKRHLLLTYHTREQLWTIPDET